MPRAGKAIDTASLAAAALHIFSAIQIVCYMAEPFVPFLIFVDTINHQASSRAHKNYVRSLSETKCFIALLRFLGGNQMNVSVN